MIDAPPSEELGVSAEHKGAELSRKWEGPTGVVTCDWSNPQI